MNKPILPMPSGWNGTIAGLFAELKESQQESIGSPDIDGARDYERSLIHED